MKHIFLLIFILFASINIHADDVNKIASAYTTQTSDLQVSSRGTVVKLLSDDNKGSRHQRFILKLSNNQTVLVAHNIDLAPKITSLRRGDVVEFNGEYEWNSKGGVIHWTHHDPAGRHQDGWLKHNGAIYE
jgi:molybdopterin converting factor small subunit